MPVRNIQQPGFSLAELKQAVNYQEQQTPTAKAKARGFSDTRIIVGTNGKPVRSPTSFWNRKIAWIRGPSQGRDRDQSVRGQQNAEFKADVYNLLLRAEGRGHTDRAFQAVLGRGWQSAGNLQNKMTTRQARQVIAHTEQLRLASRQENQQAARSFVRGNVWPTLFNRPGVTLPATSNNAQVRDAVLQAVVAHPDFSRRSLTPVEIESTALATLQNLSRKSEARVASEFPELSSRFQQPAALSTDSSIDALRMHFANGDATHGPGRFRDADFKAPALTALDQIQQSSRCLREVHFKVDGARQQLEGLSALKVRLQQTRAQLLERNPPGANDVVAPDSAAALHRALVMELSNQISRIDAKTRAITDYLHQDPLSDKVIYRPRALWAQAVVRQGRQIIADMTAKISKETDSAKQMMMSRQRDEFEERLGRWERSEQAFQNGIQPGVRSMNPQQRDAVLDKYTASWAKAELLALAKNRTADGSFVHSTHLTSLEKPQLRSITTSALKQRRLDVMHGPDNWQTASRIVTASRNGVTQTFEEENTPISVSGNINARKLRQLGIGGLVPEARGVGTAPVNARTSRLFAIDDQTSQRQLIHERQQHAIVDHWNMGNALNKTQRRQANAASAKMLLTEAITTDAEFLTNAIDRSSQPNNNAPLTLYYVNSNETSPNNINELNPGHAEYTYSQEQARAFHANTGSQQFEVDDPRHNGQRGRQVNVNIEFIDFRFPVNYAIDDGTKHKAFTWMGRVWAGLGDHNRAQLGKLVGNLGQGARIDGAIGQTMRGLERIAAKGDAPDATVNEQQAGANAKAMLADLQRHADNLRHMLNDENYKSAPQGDRFKAPRELDLLTNVWRQAAAFQEQTENGGQRNTRVISAGNCMSAKDREGNTGQESRAAAIIEHMGGQVQPGADFDNEEDRVINNTMLTGGVINTARVTGFGGGKNTKEHPQRMLGGAGANISDAQKEEYQAAYEYSMGTSNRAKT